MKINAKGDYAHAEALGVDEHDADYGKWRSSEQNMAQVENQEAKDLEIKL